MENPTVRGVSIVAVSLVTSVLTLPFPSMAQSRLTARTSADPAPPGYVLCIESDTTFLNSALLEERLLERPEFDKLGLAITRNCAEADLMIGVRRSSFTSKFNYSILDRRTARVLAGGQVSSLFGTAAGRIARKIVETIARRPRKT
jgi:hypothetical protein